MRLHLSIMMFKCKSHHDNWHTPSNLGSKRNTSQRIGAKTWNSIPENVRNLSKHEFKKEDNKTPLETQRSR